MRPLRLLVSIVAVSETIQQLQALGANLQNNYSGLAEQTTLNFRDDDPERSSKFLIGKG